MANLPKPYRRFKGANPAVVRAYEELGEAGGEAGVRP